MPASVVQEWIATVKSLGLKSIICFLDEQHLGLYQSLTGGLRDAYRESGFTVGHVPVVDYQWPPLSPEELLAVERLFEDLPKPVEMECSPKTEPGVMRESGAERRRNSHEKEKTHTGRSHQKAA